MSSDIRVSDFTPILIGRYQLNISHIYLSSIRYFKRKDPFTTLFFVKSISSITDESKESLKNHSPHNVNQYKVLM